MMNEKKGERNFVFNSVIEYSLRALVVLNALNGKRCDIQKLLYLDFLLIHSGDFEGSLDSVHPNTPYRYGEIYVKREGFQNGLKLMSKKELINVEFTKDGVEYSSNQTTSAFLSHLESQYYKKLDERSKWLVKEYGNYTNYELKFLLESHNLQFEFDREY